MLGALSKLLGLSPTDAEASMHSERAARHVLSRRSAIGLGAAMCAGSLLKFATPDPLSGYEFRIGAYGSLALAEPSLVTAKWIPLQMGVSASDYIFREGDWNGILPGDIAWIPINSEATAGEE